MKAHLTLKFFFSGILLTIAQDCPTGKAQPVCLLDTCVFCQKAVTNKRFPEKMKLKCWLQGSEISLFNIQEF